MVETFSSELAHEKIVRQKQQQQNASTVVENTNSSSANRVFSSPNNNSNNRGCSTPTPKRTNSSLLQQSPNSQQQHQHRLLQLPPMMMTSPNNTSNQQQQQQHHDDKSTSEHRRVNDIIERERRQHAIEATQMESEIETLSNKIDQLEEELQRTHKHYQQKALEEQKEKAMSEQPSASQHRELLLTKQQLSDLSETCTGLTRVRKEESKRSLQIIAELEKQVAQQQDTIALREMELDRLENGGIMALVELHLNESQRRVFESEFKAELAAKHLYLREKTYPHSFVTENSQLREQLFDSQCQSDEREKSLALTQQRLKDVREQLQVSDAEAGNFINQLKTSKEWRELTLCASEETAAVVKVINDLMEHRKQNLKQQEEAQAKRYRMVELRLGEEVVARRQKNIQKVSAPEEAEKLLSSYKEQVKGQEEILKRQLNQRIQSYNTSRTVKEVVSRIVNRSLEKRGIPMKEMKGLLGIDE